MDKQVLAVQMENVSKFFGGICAVNNVSLEIRKGTIHALMGENGAGKSTLMKMLCGIISTDKGTIKLDGKQVKLHSLIEAQEHKLAIVPQELALVCLLYTSNLHWSLGHEKQGKPCAARIFAAFCRIISVCDFETPELFSDTLPSSVSSSI